MTSNSNSNRFNDGEVTEQSLSDNQNVGSINLSSLNLTNVSNSQVVHGHDSHVGLLNVNDNYNVNPSLALDSNLMYSTSSVRRRRSIDVTDDYTDVSHKKSSKRSSNQVTDKNDPVIINSSTARVNSVISSTSDSVNQQDIGNNHYDVSADNNKLNQRFSITNESTRYALTRFPFSPFVLQFKSGKVTVNQVKDELIRHCKTVHQIDIHILNCRLIKPSSNINQYNILIYVKDVTSFACFLNHEHWPKLLGNESYILSSLPSIPPQLCCIIKNVDLNINYDEFCEAIHNKFPEVKNIVRLKNKFQNDIKMVKLELTCPNVRDKLLNDRRILINHISYVVAEFLAPAHVLICSKCMALGHFQKQCSQTKETCRTCSEVVDNMKNHICSKIEKCTHCQSNHKSSSLKCPVVKAYRAELTRKLLHLNNPPAATVDINNIMQNYVYKSSNFSPPPVSYASAINSTINPMINPMMKKLDELMNTMSEMKNQLASFEVKQNTIEQFIIAKQEGDDLIKQNLDALAQNQLDMKKDVIHHGLFIDRHENLFMNLLLPMFQDVFIFISSLNKDKKGNTLDTDLKDKIECYLKQMNKVKEGENKNGGVLMLVKNFIKVSRIECKLPNVCVVDVKGVEVVRLLGVYAPTSKSWNWQDLSPYVTKKCIIYGDFNVDFCQDIQKAESLLSWADEHFLAPFLTGMPTSLRSDREVDYAFASNINITIQAYSGKTSSDHVPILSVIPFKIEENNVGKNVHWKVFSLFTEYTFSFWEGLWNFDNLDNLYNDYTKFLFLLSARCTIVFPIEKYRPAIPVELRSFLSFIRALSFRQMRTKCSELRNEVNCLRKIAKKELKNFFSSNLSSVLRFRNSSSPAGNFFWSRTKKHLKPSSSSVHALIDSSGKANKDPVLMCEVAADYYEKFFRKSVIIRPHPYTDSPFLHHENVDELIPEVTLEELIYTVQVKRKKKSVDAHGICNYMFNFLDLTHWSLFLTLFNHSFKNTILPDAWKETRMILIAKKESICSPALTRPISLIDSFLKIGERLFLNRFRDVLLRRGLLPDNQSGFRDGFRLQTRLLLFLEDVYSLMSNSAPVCTMFIDFRSAFDQLWHSGCVGKLFRLGIPRSYILWTDAWLRRRRCYIEIKGHKSRYFNIEKGGPQGSVLTPTLFISYHCDMGQFLSSCTSHFFADDVAAILAGQMGVRFTDQCLDLEKRVKSFLDRLEFYSCLSDQPLNRSKTDALFSARAIGLPKFTISFDSDGGDEIKWKKEYKYLGYIISSKLGWGKLIKDVE
ncbi:unnamed protein product, partial [Adineta steineri]